MFLQNLVKKVERNELTICDAINACGDTAALIKLYLTRNRCKAIPELISYECVMDTETKVIFYENNDFDIDIETYKHVVNAYINKRYIEKYDLEFVKFASKNEIQKQVTSKNKICKIKETKTEKQAKTMMFDSLPDIDSFDKKAVQIMLQKDYDTIHDALFLFLRIIYDCKDLQHLANALASTFAVHSMLGDELAILFVRLYKQNFELFFDSVASRLQSENKEAYAYGVRMMQQMINAANDKDKGVKNDTAQTEHDDKLEMTESEDVNNVKLQDCDTKDIESVDVIDKLHTVQECTKAIQKNRDIHKTITAINLLPFLIQRTTKRMLKRATKDLVNVLLAFDSKMIDNLQEMKVEILATVIENDFDNVHQFLLDNYVCDNTLYNRVLVLQAFCQSLQHITLQNKTDLFDALTKIVAYKLCVFDNVIVKSNVKWLVTQLAFQLQDNKASETASKILDNIQ